MGLRHAPCSPVRALRATEASRRRCTASLKSEPPVSQKSATGGLFPIRDLSCSVYRSHDVELTSNRHFGKRSGLDPTGLISRDYADFAHTGGIRIQAATTNRVVCGSGNRVPTQIQMVIPHVDHQMETRA
jgi:hypothetical protein